MLYLVGETKDFDAKRAHALSKQKTVCSIARGIYCDPSDADDLPGFMKKNAIRIANYLNPNACLAFASAYYKGAVDVPASADGFKLSRLFVAGSYYKVFKLPYLEVVQAGLLENPGYFQFARPFQDGRESEMGDLGLSCMSEEMVFLQNFGRRRYYAERFLSDRAMIEMRRMLEERHGAALPDKITAVARQCGDLGTELDRAFAALARPVEEVVEQPVTVAAMNFGWHRRQIAHARFDGVRWTFGYEKGWVLPVIRESSKPGLMPAYVANMLPEGFSAQAINDLHIETGAIKRLTDAGERYLSNIVISGDPDRLSILPIDRLYGRLAAHRRDGEFTGRLSKVPRVQGVPLNDLRELSARLSMPRIPGYRPKLPMCLDDRGALEPADGKPFTHILKFPGITADPLCAISAVEWACMDMAKAAGVVAAESAMVKLPDGTIGLISERFDVPRDEDDMRMLSCEDMCSAFGKHPNAKYSITYEGIGEKLRELSTNFADDAQEYFRQVCVNFLLENGDFHLKNVSLLKVANPMLDGYRSVRLAPVYDVVATRRFNVNIAEPEPFESMALQLNGKVSGIDFSDLVALAETLGIAADRAHDLGCKVASGIARRAGEIVSTPPEVLSTQPAVLELVVECCERALSRISTVFPGLGCVVHSESELERAPGRRTCP
jgi:serine/threonine-protein kinase HipA